MYASGLRTAIKELAAAARKDLWSRLEQATFSFSIASVVHIDAYLNLCSYDHLPEASSYLPQQVHAAADSL